MGMDLNKPVRIRLLIDIPVDKKYGLTKGRELTVYPEVNYRRGYYPRWWYYVSRSAMLDPVGIVSHEAEVI
jgi:hypothetical protein